MEKELQILDCKDINEKNSKILRYFVSIRATSTDQMLTLNLGILL